MKAKSLDGSARRHDAASRRHFLTAGLMGLAATSHRAKAGPAGDMKSQDADAIAERTIAPSAAPARSFAVAGRDGVNWKKAYGKSDLELDVVATPRHSFRIGSVSKVLTTAVAARLVAQGKLDLDAPISAWLADLPPPHRQTTLRQLFTHRGGVRHYLPRDFDPAAPGGAIFQRNYRSNTDVLAVFINDPLVGPPGAQIHYSSFGFSLASIVMEKAAGRTFPTMVLEDIGQGFGLQSLAKDEPLAVVPYRTRGYSNAEDMKAVSAQAAAYWYAGMAEGWANIPYFNPAYCWAGGGFVMSPADMAAFGAALLAMPQSRISDAERALLFKPLTERTGNMPPLGLAWRIDADAKGRRRYHHEGTTLGGRASLVLYPNEGLAIAMATNVLLLRANVGQISSDLADVFA